MKRKGTKRPDEYLSRRERQVMDAVYRRGKATVKDICADIEDIPNYTAGRVLMHLLEDKGLLSHERVGQHYVYHPTRPAEKERRGELEHLMHTFFEGSPKEVMADLLEMHRDELGEGEWDEIFGMIEEARKKER